MRKCYILSAFTVFLLFFLFFTEKCAALPGWDSKATIRIVNPSGELTNYAVDIVLDTSALFNAGKIQADGSDIRFLDSDDITELDYWIEPENGKTVATSTVTRIWVKVPVIPAGGNKEIYMYYDNPTAPSAQNGKATFIFFDDFTVFDDVIWEKTHASSGISENSLRITNGSVYSRDTVLPSPEDILLESRIKWTSSSGSYSGFMISDAQRTSGSNTGSDAVVYYMTQSAGGNMSVAYWAADGSVPSYNFGSGQVFAGDTDTSYVMGMVITSENKIGFYKDYEFQRSVNGSWDEPFFLWMGYFTGEGAGSVNIKDAEFDWIRARHYLKDPPRTEIYMEISRMDFITEEQTITRNDISQAITFAAFSAEGIRSAVPEDSVITLSSSSNNGQFSLTRDFSSPVSQLTIPAGSDSATFYYRDSSVGIFEISASGPPISGWDPASQTMKVLSYSGRTTEDDMREWTYSGKVEIDNAGGGALSDFQVKLEIDTRALVAMGHMQPDGRDIRFLDEDNVTELPYWIESGMNSDSTVIWIKVPSIPADSRKEINFYYGNNSALPASTGKSTFDLFDDFDEFRTEVWESTEASSSGVSGSWLEISRGAVHTIQPVEISSPIDRVVESKMLWTSSSGSYSGFMISDAQGTRGSNNASDAVVYYMTQSGGGNMSVNYWAADGSSSSYNLGSGAVFTADLGMPYIMGFTMTSGNEIRFYRDYDLEVSTTGSWDSPFYLWMGYFTGDNAGSTSIKDMRADWIRIRKYAPLEPRLRVLLPITQLGFSTPRRTVIEDRVSDTITVQAQNDIGMPYQVDSDTEIFLESSSDTGQFSDTPDFINIVEKVTIIQGNSSADLYYRDRTAGTHTITAREFPSRGWRPASQNIDIVSAVLVGRYRRKIAVTNAHNVDLDRFQVPLEIDTATPVSEGKMNLDGSDIRFLDSDNLTPLNYWIESGMGTPQTLLWVNIPDLPVGSKDIYMYYGRAASPPAADGHATFDFFDDFEILDMDKWSSTSGDISTDGSELSIPRGALYTDLTVLDATENMMVESKLFWQSSSGTYSGLMISDAQGTRGSNTAGDAVVYYMTQSAGGNMSVNYWAADGNTNSYNFGSGNIFTAELDTDYIIGFVITGDNDIRFYRNYSALRIVGGSWSRPFYLWMGYFTGSNSRTVSVKDLMVDWVRIRKYARNVAVSVGDEESVASGIVFVTAPQTIVQNISSGIMTVEIQDSGGNPAPVPVDTYLRLSSDSAGGTFASEDDPFSWSQDPDNIYVVAGGSSVSFYYRDPFPGRYTLKVSENPSQGWDSAEQEIEITPSVNTFFVEAGSPVVAGEDFVMVVKAIGADGGISKDFDGTVFLEVNYVLPDTGSGSLSVTQIENFVEGIAEIRDQSFSDCGIITIIASSAEDPTKRGSSSNLTSVPHSFSVGLEDVMDTADGYLQIVKEPFGLTLKALNARGEICPNYIGPAHIKVDNVEPATDQGGILDPDTIGTEYWENGEAVVDGIQYDRWGRIGITAEDTNLRTQKSDTIEIMFIPLDLFVTIPPPPPSRDYFYLNENFMATVTARNYNGDTIPNYQGTILFSGAHLEFEENSYTFVEADAGIRQFTGIRGTAEAVTAVFVSDQDFGMVEGFSDDIQLREGMIKIVPTSGPVGEIDVMVKIIDRSGRILAEDNSTRFRIRIDEFMKDNDSCSSAAEIDMVTVRAGTAFIVVENTEQESVRIIPESIPALTPVPGIVRFGTVGPKGIGVDIWREVED